MNESGGLVSPPKNTQPRHPLFLPVRSSHSSSPADRSGPVLSLSSSSTPPYSFSWAPGFPALFDFSFLKEREFLDKPRLRNKDLIPDLSTTGRTKAAKANQLQRMPHQNLLKKAYRNKEKRSRKAYLEMWSSHSTQSFCRAIVFARSERSHSARAKRSFSRIRLLSCFLSFLLWLRGDPRSCLSCYGPRPDPFHSFPPGHSNLHQGILNLQSRILNLLRLTQYID